MGVKMNSRIITKDHAADSKKGSPQRIDFRADGTHDSHPTARALNLKMRIQNPELRFSEHRSCTIGRISLTS